MPTFDMTMPMTHTSVATNTMIKPERASSMLTAKLDTCYRVVTLTMQKPRNMEGKTTARRSFFFKPISDPILAECWPGVSNHEVPAIGCEFRKRLTVALLVRWQPRLLRGRDKCHECLSMAVVGPAFCGHP